MLLNIPRGNTRVLVFLVLLCMTFVVFKMHDGPSGGDWTGEYKRKLQSGSSKATVDCVSWEPLEIKQHNMQMPERAREAWIMKQKDESESSDHRKESFAKIYEKHEWGSDSKSGPGSLLVNAMKVINVLNILIERIKKKTGKDKISFLDSSCGDMTWMPTFLENRTDLDFTGYDIVQANIDNHRKRFASQTWKFEAHDLVADSIPKFDLILSRHTMMHLKSQDVVKVLKNFYDSGSNYLLATNFPEIETNEELSEDAQWRYRQINLHLPPFSLPPPVCQAKDADNDADYITFWELGMLG